MIGCFFTKGLIFHLKMALQLCMYVYMYVCTYLKLMRSVMQIIFSVKSFTLLAITLYASTGMPYNTKLFFYIGKFWRIWWLVIDSSKVSLPTFSIQCISYESYHQFFCQNFAHQSFLNAPFMKFYQNFLLSKFCRMQYFHSISDYLNYVIVILGYWIC